MPVITDDKGQYLIPGDDGQWVPTKSIFNPETGKTLIHDGQAWVDAPLPKRSTDEQIVRGIGMPAQGFNESLARTLGFLPDTVGAGLRGFGLPSSTPNFYTDLARKGIHGVTTLGGLLPDAPKPETTTEKVLYGAGEGAGDAAATIIPGMGIAKAARAGGTISELGKAIAAQPVTQVAAGATGGAVREATDSPLAGLTASLAMPVGMAAASRAVLPIRPNLTPERQRLVDVAEQLGIPISVANRTGSQPLKYLEGTFDTLPFTAAPQEKLRQAEREAVNRASLSFSGTSDNVATPEVLNRARGRIGGVIQDITERNVVNLTPQVKGDLQGMAADFQRLHGDDVGRPLIARIDEILSREFQGAIPGQYYGELDSQLSRQIRNTDNGNVREALRALRSRMRTAFDDSVSPEDAAAWKEAKRDWANIKVTSKAVSGAGEGAAEGNVSPLQLRGAVQQGLGGDAYALGQGDQNDLARVGQSLLRKPPQSGTGPRTYWQNLLTGSAIPALGAGGGFGLGGDVGSAALGAAAGLAAPRLAQALYNSRAGQRYLTEGIPGMAGLAQQAPDLNSALALALSAPYAKNQATGPHDMPTIVVRPPATGRRP